MMRIIWLILITFCLGFSHYSDALESEEVKEKHKQSIHISVDDKTHQSVRQIVFGFEQDIALNGAVPSPEQLQYFSITKKVNKAPEFAPECLWRFLDQRRLACELKTPLLLASIYLLEVKAGFAFLNGKKLRQGKLKEIQTEYPLMPLSAVGAYRVTDFPQLFTSFVDLKVDLSVIAGFLHYRLPDGDVIDVKAVMSEFEQQNRLQIDFDPQMYGMRQGQYQLQLKAGFQLPYADYALSENLTVFSYHYYRDFNWLGFACGYHAASVDFIALDDKGTLDCQPDEVQLVFSRYPKADSIKNALTPKPMNSIGHMEINGVNVVSVQLNGEREYRLDLSKVVNRQGQAVENIDEIRFTTIAAKPDWHLVRDEVYELDGEVKPLVGARSVYDMSGRFTPINSANELLLWLNGQLDGSLKSYDDNWPLQYKNRSDIKAFDIPYQQYLANDNLTGLVNANLSANQQQQQHLLNLAGFHLSLWREQEWLIYATDWHLQQPLKQARFSFVCRDMSEPFVSGSTDEFGMLVIPRQLIKSVESYSNQGCWLWGEVDGLTTAMQLPSYYFAQNDRLLDVAVKGWASQPVYQPGDVVQLGLIARQRGELGIEALTEWGERQLWLKQPHRQFKQALEMPQLSQFGFADLTIDTQDWLPGHYVVALENPQHNIKDDHENVVVEFQLEQFTPPEYEVVIDSPIDVQHGDDVKVDIAANRLNGVALEGAKVSVIGNISASRLAHDRWPQGFSWVEPINNVKRPSFAQQYGVLDQNGYFRWQVNNLNLDFAMAAIRLDVTITAKDGEVQQHHHSLNYFAADRFIGLKWHEDKRAFDLIAVDQQGKEVELTDVNLNFATRKGEGLPACQVKKLPATCHVDQKVVDAADGGVIFTVKTDGRDYKTSFYRFHFRQPTNNNAQRKIRFGWQENNVSVDLDAESDNKFSAVLNSPVAAKVQFVLMAGGIKRHWQQDVTIGRNVIELPVSREFMPVATLHSVVLMPRGAKRRHMQASLNMTITSSQTPLQVETQLNQSVWQSGDDLQFNIQSNKDVDSQSWLVSEALWQLLNVGAEDFDLAKKLALKAGGDRYVWSQYWFELMLEKLGHKDIAERLVGSGHVDALSYNRGARMESITVSGASHTGFAGFFGDSAADSEAGDNSQTQKDFVQSVWLPLTPIKAKQKQQLQFKLPKVPGRFKLVTISGNNQQISTQVKTIVTKLPQEFFLDAPKQMRVNDKSSLLLTSINRQAETVETTLSILLNQQPIDLIDIKFAANQQKVTHYQLPPLSVGTHLLQIRHPQLGIVAEQQVQVTSDSELISQSWLYQMGQLTQFELPANAYSTQLQMSPIDGLAPNWQKQMGFVKDYPHQCWEQSLSRALSYAYIPQNRQLWPQGEQYFKRLLTSHNQDSTGAFSYFYGAETDAFLTAYSYLASQWLSTKGMKLSFNQQLLEQYVEGILRDEGQLAAARSMALAGLSFSGKLKGDELLSARQAIGDSTGFALALQLLALKQADADPKLQAQVTQQLLTHGYQDASVSVLTDNAERCFAALALPESHPSREQLIATVRNQQWAKGDFGSTFAAGVCSYLLQDAVGTNPKPIEIEFERQQQTVSFQPNAKDDYWLEARYRQDFGKAKPVSQGIQINRQYYLRKIVDDQPTWLPLESGQTLVVGDVVRVELLVNSPLYRSHGAITDYVAGGFEVVNERFAHQVTDTPRIMRAGNQIARQSMVYVHKEIDIDKVRFYPQSIYQGEQSYGYLVKVRHRGQFIAPPAKVELMYNSEVKASTDHAWVKVR